MRQLLVSLSAPYSTDKEENRPGNGGGDDLLASVAAAAKLVDSSQPLAMDDEDSMLDRTASFSSLEWDCDGCPPPYFDLPPPPKPPSDGDGDDFCPSFEACHNVPVIVDSRLSLENDLLNVLAVVVSALVLVLLVLVTACLVWRKRSALLTLSRGKALHNQASTSSPPFSPCHDICGPPTGSRQGSSSSSFFTTFNQGKTNAMELVEQHPRHVYANPNYPTMEIGGMPFYLVPSNAAAAQTLSADASGRLKGDQFELPPERSLEDQGKTLPARLASAQPPQQHFYEPGYAPESSFSSSSARSGGPIYEDIDRMCTYRGSPPEATSSGSQPASSSSSTAVRNGVSTSEESEKTYYNVTPSTNIQQRNARFSRPDSGGSASSPLPCGTSSSEVSFDSGSSPRHNLEAAVRGGSVTVNPLHAGMSPRRPPASPRTAAASVYYYADTLRPRRDESDSGVSSGAAAPSETPPPLPSSRLAALSTPKRGDSTKKRAAQKRSPLAASKSSRV